jgi:thiamine pyrophosphokinase
MPEPRAVIFANGNLPDPEAARALLLPDDILLAADGGIRHLLAFGLKPSIVIGDLDSVGEDDRRSLEESGTHFIRHPRDKDETDLELALNYAVEAGHKRLLILGALGGRIDQTLANLSLLADPALAGLDLRLDDGVEEAFFVRSECRVEGRPGEVVSLIPWGVPAEGVTTTGLRWPLNGDTLIPYKTRGISNEMTSGIATVSIRSGLLCIVHRHNRDS